MLAQQIRGLGTAAPHRRHTLGSRSSHTNELPPLEPLAVPEDGDVATQLKLVRMRSDDSISAPVGGARSALPVDLVATKPIGVPPPPPRCCCCPSGRRLWVNLCQVHDPNSVRSLLTPVGRPRLTSPPHTTPPPNQPERLIQPAH